MIRILVVTDTKEQIETFREQNVALIPCLTHNQSRELRGKYTDIRMTTIEAIEAHTCGLNIDTVINLSSVDGEELNKIVWPCLWNRIWADEEKQPAP